MAGVVIFVFNSKSVVVFYLIQHVFDVQNQVIANVHHSVMTTS